MALRRSLSRITRSLQIRFFSITLTRRSKGDRRVKESKNIYAEADSLASHSLKKDGIAREKAIERARHDLYESNKLNERKLARRRSEAGPATDQREAEQDFDEQRTTTTRLADTDE
jgi:hypothetical protein